MSDEHPLIERAQRYLRREVDLAPAGCWYDSAVGAWRLIETGELWVETPDRAGPRTKKNDIETGEDQKGE
jgi:hypothetical protein